METEQRYEEMERLIGLVGDLVEALGGVTWPLAAIVGAPLGAVVIYLAALVVL